MIDHVDDMPLCFFFVVLTVFLLVLGLDTSLAFVVVARFLLDGLFHLFGNPWEKGTLFWRVYRNWPWSFAAGLMQARFCLLLYLNIFLLFFQLNVLNLREGKSGHHFEPLIGNRPGH